ncbi:alpha 1-4-glycosyltransferase family protein [Striga hermonthica]|uniref:Alpha 1-4-glycosyltransferase family protein n=1 Tax=Striga hermonthica TaxID=68872 RepID=A0A9N7R3R1_STRHE|nr:alpha 1-4-glycosyltransferase family protein [Striga hermonthica]
MRNFTKPFLSQLTFHFPRSKKSFYALLSVFSICLLAYNSASIFSTRVPFPAKIPPEPAIFSSAIVAGKSRKFFSLPSSAKLSSSSALYSVRDEAPAAKSAAHMHKNRNLVVPTSGAQKGQKGFESRVRDFFAGGGGCKLRFFMTWISSSSDSFGERELFAVTSLFKAHPNMCCCLIIASNSLDSDNGTRILRPLLDKGFKVAAFSPDFDYLFKGTPAGEWYNQLMRGNVNPGEVPLGQNLSNLLRLGLLYKFGGIYLDTDVIVLKSLDGLKNAIGAQTVDRATKIWSRLNNAVMIFDRGHPLLYKFIQEFALTFDGNKWGHNGPYMVSRVVSRVAGRPGYRFTIMPPTAFYPVDWSKIGSLFEGPKGSSHSKWIVAKSRQIMSKSLGVHLWNKQSRGFEVQNGSIIQHIMLSSGYNFSTEV